jgi:hypothetical protein
MAVLKSSVAVLACTSTICAADRKAKIDCGASDVD